MCLLCCACVQLEETLLQLEGLRSDLRLRDDVLADGKLVSAAAAACRGWVLFVLLQRIAGHCHCPTSGCRCSDRWACLMLLPLPADAAQPAQGGHRCRRPGCRGLYRYRGWVAACPQMPAWVPAQGRFRPTACACFPLHPHFPALSTSFRCPCLPCPAAEAEEQLLNAKLVLRAYTETVAKRDPDKSARTAVAAAGAHITSPCCFQRLAENACTPNAGSTNTLFGLQRRSAARPGTTCNT